MTLNTILSDWDTNKHLYKKHSDQLKTVLTNIVDDLGISARIMNRTKNEISIVKKLYKNGTTFENYENMTDKSAARVICRFKEDTELVAEKIRENFVVIKEEDKSSMLDVKEIDYKSLHFDVKLKEDTTDSELYNKIGNITGEIQIRTLCEDVWAEIHHDIAYKPFIELPRHIQRHMYCLGGLLEVADDCFSNVNQSVEKISELNEYTALNILEQPFIKIYRMEYDKKLSNMILKEILPLFGGALPDFKDTILNYINLNELKLKIFLKERRKNLKYYFYLTQPEAFLLFYLLENKPFELRSVWENLFPLDDLEKVSIWWGSPMSDIIEE